MIYKEEVFLWFSQLSGANRIATMHGLLSMCVPFELRFLGTCVEAMCQKNFEFLRETEYKANSPADLAKLLDLSQRGNRGRYVVSLALLHSSNRNCAAIIFNVLGAYMQHCLSALAQGPPSQLDASTLSEIVLLFTLALYHPAFTFDQKNTLELYLHQLTELCSRLNKPEFREQQPQECCQSCLHPVAPVEGAVHHQATGTVVVCEAPPPQPNGPITTVPPFGPANTSAAPVAPCFVSADVPNVVTAAPPAPLVAPAPFLPVVVPPPPVTNVSSSSSTSVLPSMGGVDSDPPGNLGGMTKCNALPTHNSKVQIKNLELKNSPRKRKGDKRSGAMYRIQVTLLVGEVSEYTEISRSHTEMFDFHQKLLNFLQETRVGLPYFTGPKQMSGAKGEELSDEGVSRMSDYLRQLMVKVPHNIINSEFIVSFFTGAGAGAPSRLQGHPNSPSSVASTTSHSPSPPLLVAPPTADAAAAAHLASQSRSSGVTADKLGQHVRALNVNNMHHQHHRQGSGDGSGSRIHHQSPEPAQTSPLSRRPSSGSSAATHRQQEIAAFPPEWDRLVNKHTTKELFNLTEDGLAREGFSSKEIKQYMSILEKLKTRGPNGFTNHQTRDDAPSIGCTTRPLAVASPVRPSGHTVQTVQTQVHMPSVSMDVLVRCVGPQGTDGSLLSSGSEGGPHGVLTTSSSSSSSSSDALCNGDSHSSYERHIASPASPVDARRTGFSSNCEPSDRVGDGKDRLRRNSRNGSAPTNGIGGGANPQKTYKPKAGTVIAASIPVTTASAITVTKSSSVTAPSSITAATTTTTTVRKRPVLSQHPIRSSQLPCSSGGDDESDQQSSTADDSSESPGPVSVHTPVTTYDGHYRYLPSPTSAPPPPHNGMNLPPPPTLADERAHQHHHQQHQPLLVKAPPPTTNYSIPPSSHSPQQQMMHMARLPSRGGNGGGNGNGNGMSQPPSGSSGTPPPPMPHPAMSYSFMPLHLYPTAFVSNGFVGSPAGVPPPNFAFMHSPDDTIAFQAMYQAQAMPPPSQQQQQQSGGPPPQQPPPQGSPAPQQRLPPPSAMPGFVAGPTPNVGFRGPSPGGGGGGVGHHGGGGGQAPPQGMMVHGQSSFVVVNGRRAKLVCFNCGTPGHHGSECNEPSMEEINKPGHFFLTYTPSNKSFDG